ncbi:MAG: hybrid sensor histidine kinase/response regulator [Deltaproteobacteria bacterium]|nr:hybrid sensor histidine kinase/response regulator [Deltaproteobacteria bacterium]MCX7952216.1 hybrid sensor histidine kinase/response regulator [Deltaproteobacteria bacterium]
MEKYRVLIADDNPDVRDQLFSALSECFEVIVARNGLEAKEKLEKNRVDLLITDFLMPEINGEELLKILAGKSRKPAVLVISGVNDPSLRAELFQYGAVAFLSKPFTHDEVKHVARNILELTKKTSDIVEETKQTFATVVTHELRTPLVAISAGSEVLLKELEDSTLTNIVTSIKKSGQRLEKFVSNLTTFQQIQLGIAEKLAIQKRVRTNFETCVNKAFRHLYEDILDIKPVFIFKGKGFSAHFLCNEQQVVTAIAKIIENSLKFVKQKSPVIVECMETLTTVRLTISDFGAGFPAGYSGDDIRPFYQPERKSLEQQGSGLGLYIAKTLTELNGGQFKIYNSKGAVNEITFLKI